MYISLRSSTTKSLKQQLSANKSKKSVLRRPNTLVQLLLILSDFISSQFRMAW